MIAADVSTSELSRAMSWRLKTEKWETWVLNEQVKARVSKTGYCYKCNYISSQRMARPGEKLTSMRTWISVQGSFPTV